MTERSERPLVATISGVEVVTIPLKDYARLLDCERRLTEARVSRTAHLANARCRIDRDPEVATFLAENLGRMLVKDSYSACVERFGAERAPSRATIARYWDRLGRRR